MAIEQFCFDIESRATTNKAVLDKIRSEEEARECPDKPKSQNPRAETIEKYEKKKAEWNSSLEKRVLGKIDVTAKDPLLAEPVCMSAVCDGELTNWSAMHGHSEEEMLQDICSFVSANCDEKTDFSGFCIKVYDLPVLVTRCRIHNIPLPVFFPRWNGRYWRGSFVDIQDLIFSRNEYLSFGDAARAYGVEGKSLEWLGSPMHGGRVQEALRAEEYDMILNYCNRDAFDEWGLLQMCMTFDDTQSQSISDQVAEIIDSELSDRQKILTLRNTVGR